MTKIPNLLASIQIAILIALGGGWIAQQDGLSTKIELLVEKVTGLEDLIERADTQVVLQGTETRKQQQKFLRLYKSLHRRITHNERFIRSVHPEFKMEKVPAFYEYFTPN